MPSRYDGNLTISIDPGLDITIPNHQLVVPEYNTDSTGQNYIKDGTKREVLINSLQQVNANDKIVLGLPFFTSAYMMVDNDREQFTIWKSQATTDSNLFAMPPLHCDTPATSARPSPTSPASHTPSVTDAIHEPTPISSGTIAGAVVGGFAGTALFLLGFFFIWRRRRTRMQGKGVVKGSRIGSHPVSPIYYKPELASDRQPPQEMADFRDPGQTDAPYEMPEGRSRQELPAKGSAALIYEMPVTTPRLKNFELPGLYLPPKLVKKDQMSSGK